MTTTYLVSIIFLVNSLLAGRIDVKDCVGADQGAVVDLGGSETVGLYVANGDGAPGDSESTHALIGFYTEQLNVNDLETNFSNMSGFTQCVVYTDSNADGAAVKVVIPLDEGGNVADVAGGYTWNCKFVSSSEFDGRRELRSLLVI